MSDKKEKTVVAIVLDRSSSMGYTQKQTISGYNEYVSQIKEDAAEAPTEVCLITFNGNVYEHFWKVPVEQLTEITDKDYLPSGSTALYDAINYTISKLQSEDDGNTSYLLIIISDGEENSSKHTQLNALKECIEGCKNDDSWTITYMGCDERYLKHVANNTGIPISSMAAWSNADAGNTLRAFDEGKKSLKKYMRSRAAGESVGSFGFYSDNMETCANFVDPNQSDVPDPADQQQDCQIGCYSVFTQSVTDGGALNKQDPVKWDFNTPEKKD